LPALGKDLTASEFFNGSSDEELLAFILVGRDANDPENTTGVAMLPRGGNPALTDEDILNIIAHIRTIP
jgi:disulfide bond formation protein DsbB